MRMVAIQLKSSRKKSKMSLAELKNLSNEEFSGREKKLEQL